MEVRCPKCYKPGIKNDIPVITEHGHPLASCAIAPKEKFPVGIISPKTGGFVQLYVDACAHCGHVVRYYFKV